MTNFLTYRELSDIIGISSRTLRTYFCRPDLSHFLKKGFRKGQVIAREDIPEIKKSLCRFRELKKRLNPSPKKVFDYSH